MKKILTFILLVGMMGVAWAQMTPEQNARLVRVARRAEKGQQLLALAKEGNVAKFKKNLVDAYRTDLRATDTYQNNLLHIAGNAEMFEFIWNLLEQHGNMREELLSQKNKSGETPFMTHIMYGHEEIFQRYFPQSDLYQQLRTVSFGLQEKNLNNSVANIKRADLLKQCSMGNQNMWQRADALYRATYTNGYASRYRQSMKNVRDMIGSVAPFMIKG